MKSRLGTALISCTGMWCACGAEEPAATLPGSCTDVELLVAASDYTTSVACGAPGCRLTKSTTGADLGDDPQLAVSGGRAFYLARNLDRIFEVDPTCGTVKPNSYFSVGALAPKDPTTDTRLRAANPHDLAVDGDTIILPLYATPAIAFVKDRKIEATLDLSSFDPDGNPQADAIRVVNVTGVPKAFVTLERLDDNDQLRVKQKAQMLRIDVATRTIEAAIDLEGLNPFNPIAELDGALFVAAPGSFDAADDVRAGIERFDTSTSTTMIFVREQDLGGSVVEIAVTEGCGAAIVAGPEKDVHPTSLVTFDPVTGKVHSTFAAPVLGPTSGYDLQGLAWRGRTLYVGDRHRTPTGFAVHVLEDLGNCALAQTERKLELPMEPVALRAASSAITTAARWNR